ncbi:MAG TPA: adenylyl-sulfate kinase [Salinivirga sp.]|uniref:adenylyl-sulfate kinase n=1 Tax=Salinivirga sp. TaxID=1970192 RepID=UPI002B4A1C74|nr:adenylyl-sulfate kinase [Salinivirga sp.]HKK58288.1 adenylyl-sulfate kinase [Salinivirga sp.]
MIRESRTRSVVKALSWRIVATFTTAALVYIFTRRWDFAAYVGAFEATLKLMFFYAHERIWNKLNYGRKEYTPKVIWFTGLSGSGKSTLAEALYKKMKSQNFKVEQLDGDIIRNIFPKTGFSKEERNRHVRRVGFLASKLEENGVTVIASFISPYRESRDFVRSQCQNFVEVYVSTPLEVCEERDVKGLYKKARKGEITQFTGIDDPYEAPENPEIEIDTSKHGIEDSVEMIMKRIRKI